MTRTNARTKQPETLRFQDVLFLSSFVLFFASDAVLYATRLAFEAVGVPGSRYATIAIIYLPLAAVLISRVSQREHTRVGGFLAIYTALVLLFGISLASNPRLAEVILPSDWPFNAVESVLLPTSAVFAYLFVALSNGNRLLWQGLRIYAYVNVAYCAARFLAAEQRGYWEVSSSSGTLVQRSYNLEFGYDLLASVLILLLFAMWGIRPLLHGAIISISMVMLVTAGSRASTAIAVFGIATLVIGVGWSRLKQSPLLLAAFATALTAALMILLNLTTIILYLQRSLERFGFDSRLLNSVIDGTLSDDNGRDLLTEISLNAIHDAGIFGYGLYGDRAHIVDTFWWGYPHNILLELQLTMGEIPGTGLAVVGLVFVVLSYVRARTPELRTFILLTGLLSLQLLVSSSLLYNPWLWAGLAGCASVWRIETSRSTHNLANQLPHLRDTKTKGHIVD